MKIVKNVLSLYYKERARKLIMNRIRGVIGEFKNFTGKNSAGEEI